MSAKSEPVQLPRSRDVVGVDFELTGPLVASAGTRTGRVVVPRGSSLGDAIEAWARECGTHIRFALLRRDRIRSEISAVAVSGSTDTRVAASRTVSDGDRIRFELLD